MVSMTEVVRVVEGDVDRAFADRCRAAGQVAWDIETSGLDWSHDVIATCQIALAGEIVIVRVDAGAPPEQLSLLLADPTVEKVFHHAMFDVRFMSHHWAVTPAHLACTKVASKTLHPEVTQKDHSLMPVLDRTLGVAISKGERLSDWRARNLSEAQLRYAADDVRYLLPLLAAQRAEADRLGIAPLIEASFAYLPTRVALDIRGAGDVFTY